MLGSAAINLMAAMGIIGGSLILAFPEASIYIGEFMHWFSEWSQDVVLWLTSFGG
jgi:hypothetical protein